MVALNVTSTVHLRNIWSGTWWLAAVDVFCFTASIAGTMPTPYEAVYGATKAFVRSFSQSLREELKETGVTRDCIDARRDRNRFLPSCRRR